MADAFETRTVTAELEVRDETDGPLLMGHAATFNDPYDVGWFRESIHPEAFSRTLKNNADVRLLVDHEGQPLARTKSGTLTLGTDGKGLTVRAQLDPTDPDVQRLIPKMRRGDMDQMSFAFRVPTGGDTMDHQTDPPHRTVREANLNGGDVSIVTYPANANADAQIRARDERDSAIVLVRSMVTEIEDGTKFDTRCTKRLMDALDFLGVDLRATVSTADVNDLPDSDFAYIEGGGTKDSDGKTVPRSLRHFPIMDAAHVRNALARAADSPFGAKAMPKILEAAKKFGVEVSQNNSTLPLEAVAILKEIDEMRRNAA